uniref:Paralemmin-3 n=1 Tax=Pogona vitticeps TaxID=103695 RepID=A0A6J0U828_9SAUR
MAETSLFAQRLQAITERRRLRERILAIRRELEEERLRAQRLKRKSLRDRWLMEGMSAPTDDSNHMSSVWEANSRIQELEQDLSSLQSQMQQLDNPEQKSKESANAVKEALVTMSPPPPPPEGGSSTEPSLELAPVPPKRSVKEATEEKLQNGEMSGDGMSGVQTALQSQKPNEPSHHRKLAVEEMVIRDHLGQAVGSMDAVGQKQSSIGKEEELENNLLLGNGCEEGNRSGPFCDTSNEEKLPSAVEGQVDGGLGSRDGPEGQSPTSCNQEGPSEPLKDKAISLESSKEQADEELLKEVGLVEDGKKGLPEEGAMETERAQDLATDRTPAAELVVSGPQHQLNLQSLTNSPGTEATAQGEGGKGPEDLHEQPKPSFPDQNPPVDETKFPDSLEEIEVSLQNPIILSPSEQISHIQQDTKASLPNPISSFQETESQCLEAKVSLLLNQNPPTVLDQTIPPGESQGSLGAEISSLVQESPLDPSLPSLQDHFPSHEEQKPLQDAAASLEEAKLSLVEHDPPHVADEDHLDQIPTSLQEQSASLQPQSSAPPPDQLASLPEKTPSSLKETERSLQGSVALQVQEPSLVEAAGCVQDVTTSSAQEAGRVSLEEISVELQDQMATAPVTQHPSLPEADSRHPGQQRLSSVAEGEHLLLEETSASVQDPVPTGVEDQEPTSPQGESPSLPETGRLPAEQRETSPSSPTAPSLREADGSHPGQAPIPPGVEMPTPLQSQASPVREATDSPDKQIPQSVAEERPTLPDQHPSPNRAPSPALKDTAAVSNALSSSSQDPSAQPLLDKTATTEDQETEEGGSASLAPAAVPAGGSPDLLENVPSEQQPLLNEPKASAAPPDVSVGDQEPKPGVLKLQTAPGQEAPTYHTSSANTASSRQLRPHQGEGQDQGQSRRKQKSCQCCSVM